MNNIKFTKYTSVRRRIGRRISNFFSHPIILCIIFLLCIVLIGSLDVSSYTPEDIKGRKIIRSVILVERECGLKDTFIIHNIDTIPDVYKSYSGDMGIIYTKGENWIGVNTDTNIEIENVKNIKIIE